MKLLVTLLLILGVTTFVQGLNCYKCTHNAFDGEGASTDACFTDLQSLTTGACDDNAGVEYCKTVFAIEDGVPITVTRACDSTGADTDTVPSSQCTIAISSSGNPTSDSTCTQTCTADDCNSQTAESLKVCSTDCGGSNGACDYLTEKCVCSSGWSGSDCLTAEGADTTGIRNCVQCSDETGSTCSSTTAATPCPGTEQYCSTTTSTVYDPWENVINTITVRGCTGQLVAVDECAFTAIYTDDGINDAGLGYKEFTCHSTCATDGCNTNTANGMMDSNELAGLYCVQCNNTVTCADPQYNTRKLCPSGTTHCKSTVTYLISEVIDRRHAAAPVSQLRSVVRECATAAVTESCDETSVTGISGMKKVTCTETCTDDGCNTGWPARPKCVICNTPDTVTDFDGCLDNPPEAKACTNPFEKYCVIVDSGIESSKRKSIQGYPRRISRKCSHIDYGTSCSSSTPRSTGVDSCNRTCTTDGCNVGSGSTMLFQTLAAITIPTVLGWLAQARL